MIRGHYFKRLRRIESSLSPRAAQGAESLKAALERDVVGRFVRLGDHNLLAVALDISEAEHTEDPSTNPGHPACAQYAGSDYCRESWQLHLAELHRQPETHWHKCDRDMLCAIVPVVCQGRCLAAVKVACPASMDEKSFARQVELLDVLAREFVLSNASSLESLVGARAAPMESAALALSAGKCVDPRPSHPCILKAIRSIEQQLTDPALSVERIARELGMDSSYLGHLFVDQTGQRMSRFIAARRIALARNLLASTDWQIKRIASETGHANPNWFCYVFRALIGVTPGGYRKQLRDPSNT